MMERKRRKPVFGSGGDGSGWVDMRNVRIEDDQVREGRPVVVYGDSTSLCNYCRKGVMGRWAFKMRVVEMSAVEYEMLLVRGWRRSGTLLYQPCDDRACCAQYAIRLDVTRFVPTRAQARIQRRIDRLLSTNSERTSQLKNRQTSSVQGSWRDQFLPEAIGEVEQVLQRGLRALHEVYDIPATTLMPGLMQNRSNVNSHLCSAVALRLASTVQKMSRPPVTARDIAERLLAAMSITDAQFIETMSASPNGFVNWRLKDSALVSLADENHASAPQDGRPTTSDELDDPQGPPSPVPQTLEVVFCPVGFSEEDFNIFRAYQIAVHHENPSDVTAKRYKEFLVDSPLVQETVNGHNLGSFRMRYLLDDKVVAVGIVDITPCYLSSVYLFYDPNHSSLSLGVYSALREIAWVQSKVASHSSFRYYSMGLYAHNCPKMRYKAQYANSELLCPVTYQWFPHSECSPLLDQATFCCFADPEHSYDLKGLVEKEATSAVKDILVCIGDGPVIRLDAIVRELSFSEKSLSILARYVSAAGTELATKHFVVKLG